jgi:hypothetical protein
MTSQHTVIVPTAIAMESPVLETLMQESALSAIQLEARVRAVW